MGVTYEDAVKAQIELEDAVLADPNVVSVGVIAETNSYGEMTGDYAVQVGVVSIDAYLSAKKYGHSSIPSEFLLHSKSNVESDKHIHIHVVREGNIEALSKASEIEESDIPSAIDNLSESEVLVDNYISRRRPSPCGQSIGHPNITAGTQGLLLEYTEGPNVGKAYILSNNHVIAANNSAAVGDEIIQPGKHDSGVVGKDTIALLHRWVPLLISDFNYVDAAIAEVKGGINWSSYVASYISHIGIPGPVIEPRIGMSVEKTGRTTGYTEGKITSDRFSTKIKYPMGTLTFKNQIRTTSMSKGGDSGSCLIEQGTNKTVGLLFAGSDAASYCNPMSVVLSSLSMSYTHQYPSGKTFSFHSDFNLRIIQKRPYSTVSLPRFSSEIMFFTKTLKVRPAKCVASVAAISAFGLFKNSLLNNVGNNISNISKRNFSS